MTPTPEETCGCKTPMQSGTQHGYRCTCHRLEWLDKCQEVREAEQRGWNAAIEAAATAAEGYITHTNASQQIAAKIRALEKPK